MDVKISKLRFAARATIETHQRKSSNISDFAGNHLNPASHDAGFPELTTDQAQRITGIVKTCEQLIQAFERYDASETSNFSGETEAAFNELKRLADAYYDQSEFYHFTFAAERLCRAKTFDDFKAALPSVDINRTYKPFLKERSSIPLIWAMSARSKPLERLQLMLAAGARTDIETKFGYTVLHDFAAMNRKAPIRLALLRLLVLKGADLEAENYRQETPLRVAIKYGSVEDVRSFLSVGSHVQKDDVKCAAEDPDKMQAIMDHIHDNPSERQLSIELAGWIRGEIAWCEENRKQAMRGGGTGDFHQTQIEKLSRSLSQFTESPELKAISANEALVWDKEPAAFFAVEHAETLDAYRTALAKVDIQTLNMAGDHPIYWPIKAKTDRAERLWLMLAAGASVEGISGNGHALHIFAANPRRGQGHQQVIAQMLLQAGAQIEARNYEGETPLSLAVACRGFREAEALLKFGANPNISASFGDWADTQCKAPLIFNAACDARIFKLLLSHGCKTDGRDARGRDLVDFLREIIAGEEAELADSDNSGNIQRYIKRNWRGHTQSLALLQSH